MDKQKTKKKQKMIILTVISGMLAAVALAWAAYVLFFKAPPEIPDTTALVNQGEYEQATNLWLEYADAVKEPEGKYRAYGEIAAIQSTKGDSAAALKYLLMAEEQLESPDFGLLLAIADSAESAGNAQLAAEYYNKALAGLDKNDPVYQANKSGIESKLEALDAAD